MRIKRNIFIYGIFFLTGAFITMPILTINIGGQLVSIFSIIFGFFYVSILWLTLKAKLNFPLNIEFKMFTIWLIISLVSSVFGIIYFGDKSIWLTQIFSYIPKIILYLLLLVGVMKLKNQEYLISLFLKGFIFGCVANLIWSIVEGVWYYFFGILLNNILFTEYVKTLPVDRQYMTLVADGIIRASGFNTDPAHLGGLIPIIVVFSLCRKNLYLLVIAFVALIFSGSTTALVASLLALLISPWKLQIHRSSLKRLGVSFAILSVLFAGVLTNEQARDGIYTNTQGFYNRTFENYVEKPDAGPRYIYHAYLIEAIRYNGLRTLTGTGFGTASYPYVDNGEIARVLNEEYYPFDPESTYISYLFDVGILGVALYLFVIISLMVKSRRQIDLNVDKIILYSSLCGIFFSGFFYHYTLTAYQILIIIFTIKSTNRIRSTPFQVAQ